jgi:hypothetical protein
MKTTPIVGKENGLEFHMKSAKVWRTLCPSHSSAHAWIAATRDNLKRQGFSVEKFLKRCVVKELPTIMCGWLTIVELVREQNHNNHAMGPLYYDRDERPYFNTKPAKKRAFFVLQATSLSIATDVDVEPEPYGVITSIQSSVVDCAFDIKFHNMSVPPLTLQCDSVHGLRNWHLVIRTCLREPERSNFPRIF